MTLNDFLELTDVYQDIQISNAKTGELYTDVTYREGGSEENINEIELHRNDEVHGVTAGIADNGRPYLLITLDSVV